MMNMGSVRSPEMLEKRTRSDNYCQNSGSSPGSHTRDWPLCAVFDDFTSVKVAEPVYGLAVSSYLFLEAFPYYILQ
jgi:hypothetical protein